MSRTVWSLLIIAALGTTLASCFSDVNDCSTCPGANSGSLDISVSQNGRVDSVYVRVDGGAQVTLKRKGHAQFTGLSEGVHVVQTTRWFNNFGVPAPRSETLDIHLDRGEHRTILFHNDFPLITSLEPALRVPARFLRAPRVG